jgi:pyruvate, water dikinase
MMETLNLFRNVYRRWKSGRESSPREVSEAFRFRYACFRDLLDSNAQLLDIIADLETKLKGHQIFGMSYVRAQTTRAAFHAFRMVKSLDVLSGHRYGSLYGVVDRIHARIKGAMGERKEPETPDLVLAYQQINRESVDWVGGKNANLGEVLNRVGLEIPAGFAVTTRCFHLLMVHDDLAGEINKWRMGIDPLEPESIFEASGEIRKRILAAEPPRELRDAILGAYHRMAASRTGKLRVSMRSSAVGEDGELTFAGQYSSLLNVPEEGLISSYLEVVASLFSSRALAYRIAKGVRAEDVSMGAACLEMVESRASGVIYSRHRCTPGGHTVLITAVWGLGPHAVDGSVTPDAYEVARDPQRTIVDTRISPQEKELVCGPAEGLKEVSVDSKRRTGACLLPEQIRQLAGYAIRLEEHFRCPQDIEWAMDPSGRLLILQTRPLRGTGAEGGPQPLSPPVPGRTLMLEGGSTASQGAACGPVFRVETDEDLLRFPDGAVLVARHSSPKYVLVMSRAQAIVTDAGSVAGHMASVAREFALPCLLDTRTATSLLPPGEEVTVDASARRVYQGRVPELLSEKTDHEAPMLDTPVYRTLKEVAGFVVPLNLLDPRSPDFGPGACRTLHDLARLVHESSYGEMFRFSDLVSDRGEGALKLESDVPLDLYLIDLGGGLLGDPPDSGRVTPADIASSPLNALLEGMHREDLRAREPRPVELAGFLSVLREQMLSPPRQVDRFGEKSYAIISGEYLNFSSRVGYHYCVLDAYCGKSTNKNYIAFSFKGGAADEIRRKRRVRAIALILTSLDFSVQVKADRVDARLLKYDTATIIDRLGSVGRLLIMTRQMDMLMKGEESVDAAVEMFLKGNRDRTAQPDSSLETTGPGKPG